MTTEPFDLDRWLKEGREAQALITKRRADALECISKAQADVDIFDAQLAKLAKLYGETEEHHRMTGITASVRAFLGEKTFGTMVSYEEIERAVVEAHEGEVPKSSTLHGVLRKLAEEGYVERYMSGDTWVKTGGLPDEGEGMLAAELKRRLRVAGSEGVLVGPGSDEHRLMASWALRGFVEGTDALGGNRNYRLTEKAVVNPEDAPKEQRLLFDGADPPPRHAR